MPEYALCGDGVTTVTRTAGGRRIPKLLSTCACVWPPPTRTRCGSAPGDRCTEALSVARRRARAGRAALLRRAIGGRSRSGVAQEGAPHRVDDLLLPAPELVATAADHRVEPRHLGLRRVEERHHPGEAKDQVARAHRAEGAGAPPGSKESIQAAIDGDAARARPLLDRLRVIERLAEEDRREVRTRDQEIDVRDHEAVEAVGIASGAADAGVDRLGERAEQIAQDEVVDRLLAREVLEERRRADADLARDLAEADAAVAVAREEPRGGAQDLLAAIAGVAALRSRRDAGRVRPAPSRPRNVTPRRGRRLNLPGRHARRRRTRRRRRSPSPARVGVAGAAAGCASRVPFSLAAPAAPPPRRRRRRGFSADEAPADTAESLAGESAAGASGSALDGAGRSRPGPRERVRGPPSPR